MEGMSRRYCEGGFSRQIMRRRTLLIALAAAALYAAVVVPASAELHRLSVTLTTGETVELTVDVPAGSSVSDISSPRSRPRCRRSSTSAP